MGRYLDLIRNIQRQPPGSAASARPEPNSPATGLSRKEAAQLIRQSMDRIQAIGRWRDKVDRDDFEARILQAALSENREQLEKVLQEYEDYYTKE